LLASFSFLLSSVPLQDLDLKTSERNRRHRRTSAANTDTRRQQTNATRRCTTVRLNEVTGLDTGTRHDESIDALTALAHSLMDLITKNVSDIHVLPELRSLESERASNILASVSTTLSRLRPDDHLDEMTRDDAVLGRSQLLVPNRVAPQDYLPCHIVPPL
jgi:hypothetical protein